jgi:hypothetical protein
MRAVERHPGFVSMALDRPSPSRPTNIVILALVAALLDLEQCRGRGKVRPPMDRRRSA